MGLTQIVTNQIISDNPFFSRRTPVNAAETVPAALDAAPSSAPSQHRTPWIAHRVTSVAARLALLRELSDSAAPVSLGRPGAAATAATLWAVDGGRCRLHFNGGPELAPLASQQGVYAAAYLGDIKLQFPLRRMSLAPALGAQVQLQAEVPQLLLRLARRRGLRLRQPDGRALGVRFMHPLAPGQPTEAVALDVSTGGCALELGPQALPLVPGMMLRAVEWLEDGEPLFYTDLEVRHVSPDLMEPYGLRVGCCWGAMAPTAQRLLAAWIERGRRRRGRVTLSLDLAAGGAKAQ